MFGAYMNKFRVSIIILTIIIASYYVCYNVQYVSSYIDMFLTRIVELTILASKVLSSPP